MLAATQAGADGHSMPLLKTLIDLVYAMELILRL
jgi:hypothetical protein